MGDCQRVSADCACDATVDKQSVVSATQAQSGSITSSVVANVSCQDISAEGAVLVGCSARKITAAKGSIGYNLVDEAFSKEGIVLAENEVRVGVFTLNRPYFEMKSDAAKTDGGKVFTTKVHDNAMSFQEVYDLNHGTDVTACAAKAAEAREACKAKVDALNADPDDEEPESF